MRNYKMYKIPIEVKLVTMYTGDVNDWFEDTGREVEDIVGKRKSTFRKSDTIYLEVS